jgi:hypothetical protein
MALVYESKVPNSYRNDFVKKVREVSTRLGIDPNWLMAIMYWESASTFSPSKQNSIGATGLIQFIPSTAIGLGTTTTALKNMSAVDQLDYVEKYLKVYKGKMNSYVDTYFAVFFPLAIGKPDDWVLQGAGISASLIARQNPAFDVNKDGKVQVWEVKKIMLQKLPSEWVNNGSIGLAIKSYKGYLTIGLLLIAIGGLYIYKNVRRK